MYFNLLRSAVLVLVSIFALQAVDASPIPDRDGHQHRSLSRLCRDVWRRITLLPTPQRTLLSNLNEEKLEQKIEQLPHQFWVWAHKSCTDHTSARKFSNAEYQQAIYKRCMEDTIEEALISMARGDSESWEPESRSGIKAMNELGVYQRL